ncbi:hypothetical protein CVT25_011407 [Psilocybe cyanescens]|uniref:Uncharacterized protein n=1 Tax=Psilocybe cyanescens TaxID=93625 RepID=A0A409WGC5_PSICY|nr:hypothetical protein CVT25_011407 [Psilocybe cyanescens]
MSPATVNVVTRVAPSPAPMLIDSTSGLNLREFVADEDAAHFSSAVLKTIADQKAFVLAQREALEAFNVAKAIRLSEETAAVESKRRIEAAASTSTSTAVVISDRAAAVTQVSSAGPNSATASQPIAIRGDARQSASSDEAAAISLARSWQVDALQPALLEAPKQSMSSSSSSPSTQKKWSTASEASQQYHHHQNHHQYDSRSSSSATAIAKQPSQNLSLSTSPSSYHLSDSRIASSSVSRASSRSTNVIPVSSTSSHHQHQHHRIEQRSLSKREPEPSSISMPTSISHSSSASTSTTRNHSSDVTNTKRRRTEQLQPSKSSSSRNTTNGALVAPPISDSKKSIASARDVRLGQIMSPILENPSEPAPPKPKPMEHRLHSRSRSVRQSSDSDLFTASRNCVKCGNLVASPRTKPSFEHDPFALPFSSVLHVVCTACGTTHCRGCFTVVRCPRDCTGGAQDCTVRNCCPDIRAIAIFEALSSFDHIYATEAGFAGKGQDGEQQQQMRQAYIKLLMSKADKSMRKFEDAFVRTLRILTTWLEAPRKGSSSGGGESDSHAQGMHRAVSHLFAASYLPEVVHAFLSNSNVRDWIAHSETYNAVLETLRRMFDRGLTAVLMRPLRHIARSCGLQGLVWDGGMITWEVDARNRPVESLSLCDLVKQLEKHRLPLMALAEKVQFSATVEKVNNLCDNISYLLLQQLAI